MIAYKSFVWYISLCKRNESYRKMFKYMYSVCSPQVSEISHHTPVMVKQMLQFLKPNENNVIIDMTFGSGGHSQAILNTVERCKIIALDRDPIAHEKACHMATLYPERVIPVLGKFSELPSLMKEFKLYQNSVDGILFDLGCSAMQLTNLSRGFSASNDGPLDMRMDYHRFPNQPRAVDILAKINEEELAKILKVYGEEKDYKKIASAITEARYLFRKLETTHELSNLVKSLSNDVKFDNFDAPLKEATKVFQALRIFVNNELNEINYGMILAQKYLKIGGRIVAVSYNSIEDTIVKRHIFGNVANDLANSMPLKYKSCLMTLEQDKMETLLENSWKPLTKHVILPSLEEIENNSISRSAKMRAAIKIK